MKTREKPIKAGNRGFHIPEDDSERLIVGGEEAVPGRHPYQVALVTILDSLVCGGTLIDPEWVLSAAHCFNSFTYVEIGMHNRTNKTELGEYERIEVAFSVIHPDYDAFTFENDVMLVKLMTPSNFSSIVLDDGTNDLSAGTNVTALGFGTIEFLGDLSDVLMEVEVDVVSNSECASLYGEFDAGFFDATSEYPITDDMICASRLGKDSCQGDSGGPLILKGEDESSDIQVGIVSFGIGCADIEFPGVYARVATADDFIQDLLTCAIPNETDISTLQDCCTVLCVDGNFVCASPPPCSTFCPVNLFPEDGFNYSSCSVESKCFISDGFCDNDSHNNPECNYDGGDCCRDTCTSRFCQTVFPNCIDPDATKYPIDIIYSLFFCTIIASFAFYTDILSFLLNTFPPPGRP